MFHVITLCARIYKILKYFDVENLSYDSARQAYYVQYTLA